MKYIIYVRVSTDQQDVDTQIFQALEYIKNVHGLLDFKYEIFSDPSISARKVKLEDRPGIQAAIKAIQKDDIFLAISVDRLGRNILECFTIREMIKARKGKIFLITQPHIGDNDIIWGVMAGMASEEVKLITTRTKSKLAALKARGERTGHIPYGYRGVEHPTRKTKRDRKVLMLQKDEKEQSILEKMVRLADEGHSLRKIADYLNTQSLLNRKGTEWSHVLVHKILKNRQRHLAVDLNK